MTEWSHEQGFARSIELWKKRGAEFVQLASCRALTASYGSLSRKPNETAWSLNGTWTGRSHELRNEM